MNCAFQASVTTSTSKLLSSKIATKPPFCTMKYRGGDHLGKQSNFTRAGAYFNSSHHNQRPNGGNNAPHNNSERKSNRAYGEVGGGGFGAAAGQGQIELVDKVLNQISMHQSISSAKPANSSKPNHGRIRAMGGDSRQLARNNSYAKKNQHPQQYSNSQYQASVGVGGGGGGGRFKQSNKFNVSNNSNNYAAQATFKMPPNHKDRTFASGSGGGGPQIDGRAQVKHSGIDVKECSKCEYVFVDGQLLPKFECTHKAQFPKSASRGAKSNGPAVTASRSRTRTRTRTRTRSRQHLQQAPYQADISKFANKVSSSSKAYMNRHNKRDAAVNGQHNMNSFQNGIGGGGPNSAFRITTGVRQSIISKQRSEDMKKFVEAQIVFDQNIIDVVPLQGGMCSFQLLSSAASILTQSDHPQHDPLKSNLSQMQLVEKPIELMPPFPLPPPSSISSDSVQLDYLKLFDDPIVFPSQPPPSSSKMPLHSQFLSPSKSIDCELVMDEEANDMSTCQALSSIVQQPQAVKKVRCLVANFITIQVEDELSEEGTGGVGSNQFSDGESFGCTSYNLQDDILKEIDSEKLGFQNFDGKNIGLYKNIGYINRNKDKFVRPTEELLQLILSPKVCTEQMSLGGESVESELDLIPFYDLQSPGSYEKEYAYSVLESLINDDGQISSQIKERTYLYPEYDYSSEGEGEDTFPLTGSEQLKNQSKSSPNSAGPGSSLTTFKWTDSDNDQLDSRSSSRSNIKSKSINSSSKNESNFPLARRYIKNSSTLCGNTPASSPFEMDSFEKRSTSTTIDPISEEDEEDEEEVSGTSEDLLFASYYITEVSFSVN